MPSHAHTIDVVTVDVDVEAAKSRVAALSKGLDRRYDIDHIANAKNLDQVKHILKCLVVPPKLLICSGRYFEEQADELLLEAQGICPKLFMIYIPSDLITKGGQETVVDYLKDQVCESKLPERK